MAEINVALQQTHHTLESLFVALDPKSLILTHNSISLPPKPIQFNPASLTLQRGSRYRAYAELRESKLRTKNKQQSDESESTSTPTKKRVTFQGSVDSVPVSGRNGTSVVARSVPDFAAALRKENRKPASTLPSILEMTPPPSSSSKSKGGVVSKLGGSKSANAGEKRGGGVIMRKSYASVEDLKGLSAAAASAINGESKGGRNSRGINKTVLSYRQY
ncbi:hypothetical protein HHK36_006930 [Tetracentron sinense]|uniref:Uncharacterized protein n=1 Tax=Tetracentron sinense TaxID=13715 RepID=A0A835DPI6_TETSI|nr:hypothetical protein HHK36_006930 [Tetracentron sinense]